MQTNVYIMSADAQIKSKRLNQAIGSLVKQIRHKKYHESLKDAVTYQEFFANKMLIIAIIRQGVPFSFFELIQEYTPFSERDWAGFLDISTKSLQRYKTDKQHLFKASHSEKIIALAEVTNLGLEVFGEMEKLRLWFNTPNFSLGNLTPIELLKDAYGKELVMGELTRINHGIFV